MKTESSCNTCINNVYDEELQYYYCQAQLDEDEVYRLMNDRRSSCPYYRPDDDYLIVRKQN
ncbi:MAG: hypothetical protein IJ737_05820 [Ruminococcus sp.]|nr:hypothetical protein [Ruminococcus sp.]